MRHAVIYGLLFIVISAVRAFWRNKQKAKPDSLSSRVDQILVQNRIVIENTDTKKLIYQLKNIQADCKTMLVDLKEVHKEPFNTVETNKMLTGISERIAVIETRVGDTLETVRLLR